ncbi:MAG: hypothetical protein Ta2B_04170 [Termitinemataceae bacterium]|nr:MAG: hypothetical protein Ta2B_04170 [Termitinemataceae bacterium]
MEFEEHFYSQNMAQIGRGTETDIIIIKGEASKNNFFEQYIKHASTLGYILKKNGAYIAIQYNGLYIVRVYPADDINGTFAIRYRAKDFTANSLMKKATNSSEKLRNVITNANDLELAMQMLTKKINKRLIENNICNFTNRKYFIILKE